MLTGNDNVVVVKLVDYAKLAVVIVGCFEMASLLACVFIQFRRCALAAFAVP